MADESNIILGFPGQWTSHADIRTTIARLSDGLIVVGEMLLDTTTHQVFRLDISDHDPDLVRAFTIAGRHSLSDADLRAIHAHTYTLYVIGQGGTCARAQQLMQVGVRLIHAGGLAVKVETTGTAHSAHDWLTLTAAEVPSALYEAYVTLIGTKSQFYSCGMHNLGLPDAMVAGTFAPNIAAHLLQTFLLYLLQEQPTLQSHQTFSVDAQSARYRLHHQSCTLYPTDDLFYNPYGMWLLQDVVG